MTKETCNIEKKTYPSDKRGEVGAGVETHFQEIS